MYFLKEYNEMVDNNRFIEVLYHFPSFKDDKLKTGSGEVIPV